MKRLGDGISCPIDGCDVNRQGLAWWDRSLRGVAPLSAVWSQSRRAVFHQCSVQLREGEPHRYHFKIINRLNQNHFPWLASVAGEVHVCNLRVMARISMR